MLRLKSNLNWLTTNICASSKTSMTVCSKTAVPKGFMTSKTK
jgi:hypothetical protein